MAKLFELRPNVNLLDSSFQGYKLSLEPMAIYKHELPVFVEHLKPSDEQFSFQHVKSFGYHNHLFADLWNTDLAFFITQDYQVFQTNLDSLVGQRPVFTPVWNIPIHPDSAKGLFNPSLSFASQNLAVVSDGFGLLHIVDTSRRNEEHPKPWQAQLSKAMFRGERPFSILHTHLREETENHMPRLCILMQRVEPIALAQEESQIPLKVLGCEEKSTPFVTLLEYVTYSYQDCQWILEQNSRVAVPHGVEYASILSPGKALCIAAREPVGMVYNSSNCVTIHDSLDMAGKLFTDHEYVWRDDPEDLMVWFSLNKSASEQDITVNLAAKTLQVAFNGQVKMNGDLTHEVSSINWTLEEGRLQIVLTKVDKRLPWDQLVTGDQNGCKVTDDLSALEWHRRLQVEEIESTCPAPNAAFTDIQMEECDAFPADESYLFRIDVDSNSTTHKTSLGSHLVLFTAPEFPTPGLCLRHDVDGLIWLPLGDEAPSWGCVHTATLQALGYVQASKEQRKFTVCAPNHSYVALCDAVRHIYIYRQPTPGAPGDSQLVHRPTGKRHGSIAKQQVVSLETNQAFLGTIATDRLLLILTSTSLYAIVVNQS